MNQGLTWKEVAKGMDFCSECEKKKKSINFRVVLKDKYKKNQPPIEMYFCDAKCFDAWAWRRCSKKECKYRTKPNSIKYR